MTHAALLTSPSSLSESSGGRCHSKNTRKPAAVCVSVWITATTHNPCNSSPAELVSTTRLKGVDLKRVGKRWGADHAWASAGNLMVSSRRQEWAPSPYMAPEGYTLSWGEEFRPGAAFSPWLYSLPIHWLLSRAQRTQMDTGYKWRAAPDGGRERLSHLLGNLELSPKVHHITMTDKLIDHDWPLWPPSPPPSFPRAGSEST